MPQAVMSDDCAKLPSSAVPAGFLSSLLVKFFGARRARREKLVRLQRQTYHSQGSHTMKQFLGGLGVAIARQGSPKLPWPILAVV